MCMQQILANQGPDSRIVLKANIQSLQPKLSRCLIHKSKNRVIKNTLIPQEQSISFGVTTTVCELLQKSHYVLSYIYVCLNST